MRNEIIKREICRTYRKLIFDKKYSLRVDKNRLEYFIMQGRNAIFNEDEIRELNMQITEEENIIQDLEQQLEYIKEHLE